MLLALLLARKQDVFLEVATFLLIVCAADQNRAIKALFCNRLALYIGTISYSFYLLHMPVIHWLPKSTTASDAAAFPLVLLISLIAATATYAVIERPTRILGRRFAHSSTLDRRALLMAQRSNTR